MIASICSMAWRIKLILKDILPFMKHKKNGKHHGEAN